MALSGGGHRATLWALGLLVYLADAERNSDVTSVASVSGGSLANGAIGQRLDYTTATADDVRRVAGDVARVMTRPRFGTVFGWWGASAYIVGTLLVLGAAVLAVVEVSSGRPFGIDAAVYIEVPAACVAVLIALRMVSLRGRVTALSFERTLLSSNGSTDLYGLHTGLDHVLCATDLHAGQHAYFSSSWVCAYQFGHGGNGGLSLGRAMQASAAFPPVFPVAWIRTGPFEFYEGTESPRSFALTDGGVYDNMADQWAHGLSRRRARWSELALKEADELIVANASAGRRWGSVRRLRLPLVGGLMALLRDKSVMYDNGTSTRREALVARFDRAQLTGEGLRGTLVHIEQSPFRIPDAFDDATDVWPERAARAQAALAALAASGTGDRDAWHETAEANAAVATTLLPFPKHVSARLMQHSYVLSMINLHVVLGYPLLPIPDREHFLAVIAGDGA